MTASGDEATASDEPAADRRLPWSGPAAAVAPAGPARPGRRLLVLGVGNVLLGDEGAGVHAVQRLAQEDLPPGVSVLDGGTGGFHLLACLADHDPVILVDAALDDRPPGTVSLIEPRFLSDFPRALSAHDIGLRDLLEAAALLGPLPKIYLVTISVDPSQPMRTTLSGTVEAAMPRAAAVVRDLVARIAASPA
jgi:hydrogenase maturation protease